MLGGSSPKNEGNFSCSYESVAGQNLEISDHNSDSEQDIEKDDLYKPVLY